MFEKTAKIRCVPVWMAQPVASVLRPFSKRLYGTTVALTIMTQIDCEDPKMGTHTLNDYYQELAAHWSRKA